MGKLQSKQQHPIFQGEELVCVRLEPFHLCLYEPNIGIRVSDLLCFSAYRGVGRLTLTVTGQDRTWAMPVTIPSSLFGRSSNELPAPLKAHISL